MTRAATFPTLTLIAAVARNGVIGKDNAMLWRLPADMQHFKRITLNHSVIMGRKTWDSLPARFRPLTDRHNIVVTRNLQWQAQGATVVHSLPAALAAAGEVAKAFVIGGAELYEQALPLADELVLTEIHRDYEGDARFPAVDRQHFTEISRHNFQSGEPDHIDYAFVTYQRKTNKED